MPTTERNKIMILERGISEKPEIHGSSGLSLTEPRTSRPGPPPVRSHTGSHGAADRRADSPDLLGSELPPSPVSLTVTVSLRLP